MSDAKFKTMRHIETVRNYLNTFVKELLDRAEHHDQSKLESPEVEMFEKYTPLLRECTYGSEEYKGYLKEMNVALEHHYACNQHHPEYFQRFVCGDCGKRHDERVKVCYMCAGENIQEAPISINEMTLIDIMEMLADWKAATLRHADGDIRKSILINQKRFGYSDEMKTILLNTVGLLESRKIFHKAEES